MTGQRLAGRRVLVVGAGTQPSDDPEAPVGNGRAIAVLAAREGSSVMCADRDRGAAEETATWIRKEGGSSSVAVADITNEQDCTSLLATAAAERLDGVVLNVGIGRGRGMAGTSAGDWDATFAANLRGHFLVAREALPALAEGGAIVFISSIAGLQPGSRLPAYEPTLSRPG